MRVRGSATARPKPGRRQSPEIRRGSTKVMVTSGRARCTTIRLATDPRMVSFPARPSELLMAASEGTIMAGAVWTTARISNGGQESSQS